jgi:CHASE3 domain sensor protein
LPNPSNMLCLAYSSAVTQKRPYIITSKPAFYQKVQNVKANVTAVLVLVKLSTDGTA